MQILTRYILLSALVVLSGCAATTAHNYLATNLPSNSLTTIADDIAPTIAEGNPAKGNSFILSRDDFGRALADNLGKRGYEVLSLSHTEQPPENAKVIRYTIDWVSPSSLYVALNINDSQRYTRTYTVDAGTLIPDKTKIIGVKDGR